MSFRDRFCQLFVSERLYFCTPKKSAVEDRSHIIRCKKSAKKDVAKVFDLNVSISVKHSKVWAWRDVVLNVHIVYPVKVIGEPGIRGSQQWPSIRNIRGQRPQLHYQMQKSQQKKMWLRSLTLDNSQKNCSNRINLSIFTNHFPERENK